MVRTDIKSEKIEILNRETLPKLREALGNLLEFNDLSDETLMLADDIVVYLSQEIEKGSIYKVSKLEEEKGYHLDNVTLVVSPKGNEKTLVAFFAFLTQTVIDVKKKPQYNINNVTPELLSQVLNHVKIL